MSVLATLAAAGVTLVNTAASFAQMRQGKKMMDEAMTAMDEYERQNLENVYEGLEVSTAAEEFQADQYAQSEAGVIDKLSKSGARGVVGGASKVLDSSLDAAGRIAAQIDEKYKERERLIAEDDKRIQVMTEQRENQDIEGLANLYGVGVQSNQAGKKGLTQTLSSFLSVIPDSLDGVDKDALKTFFSNSNPEIDNPEITID